MAPRAGAWSRSRRTKITLNGAWRRVRSQLSEVFGRVWSPGVWGTYGVGCVGSNTVVL